MKRQNGIALPMVFTFAAIIALVLAFVIVNTKKSNDATDWQSNIARIAEYKTRVSNILSAPHLCTCNLKDLIVIDSPSGQRVELLPNGPHRLRYGFYRLLADSSCAGPDEIAPEDVVLHLNATKDAAYPRALTVDKIWIDSFVEDTNFVDGNLKHYKAAFKFASNKDLKTSMSNQAQPIDIDVYVEVNVADNRIVRCYPPIVATPPPPTGALSKCETTFRKINQSACSATSKSQLTMLPLVTPNPITCTVAGCKNAQCQAECEKIGASCCGMYSANECWAALEPLMPYWAGPGNPYPPAITNNCDGCRITYCEKL